MQENVRFILGRAADSNKNFDNIILFISEEKMRESGSHVSYKESLLKEMKELVDSFYRDVQIKICSIKKTQKCEIRDMIKELKRMKLGEKSSKQRKKVW